MKCTSCGHPEAYQGLGSPECPHMECRFFSAKQRDLIYPPAVPATVTLNGQDFTASAHRIRNLIGYKVPKSAFRAALERDCAVVGIAPPPDDIDDRQVWDAIRNKIGAPTDTDEFEYCRSSFD